MRFVRNAAGRMVPTAVNRRTVRPYAGPDATPAGPWKATLSRGHAVKGGEDKVVDSIEKAVELCGLKDGMTVSFHHHLRDGDSVANMVMDVLASMGFRDLLLFPSAMFPVHGHLIEHIESGVIRGIDGSLNGPLGDFVCHGGMLPYIGTLRSHGGRVRALHSGDVHIDVAFLAAPTADTYGNSTGTKGPNACGPLGYAHADAMLAGKTVIITDNLVDFPCWPISITQEWVDHVVPVKSIGDHEKIVSGTTQVTKDPKQLAVSQAAVDLMWEAGVIKDGLGFQAGAGGIALASSAMLADKLEAEGIKAKFISAGGTAPTVDMLRKGLVEVLLEGQAFDLEAIKSMIEDPSHIEVTPGFYANIHGKGCLVNQLDTVVLGATEVDVDFNTNVVTHSDGRQLHGIGGHMDTAAGAKLAMMVVPLYRKTNPIVREEVTTITAPGETVDAVVTDQGMAINPRRKDLLEKLKGSKLDIVPMEQLKDRAYEATGRPEPPRTYKQVTTLIEYRDGTALDVVRRVRD